MKKSERIFIRCTPYEKEKLKELAKKNYMSLSGYIYHCIIRKEFYEKK